MLAVASRRGVAAQYLANVLGVYLDLHTDALLRQQHDRTAVATFPTPAHRFLDIGERQIGEAHWHADFPTEGRRNQYVLMDDP